MCIYTYIHIYTCIVYTLYCISPAVSLCSCQSVTVADSQSIVRVTATNQLVERQSVVYRVDVSEEVFCKSCHLMHVLPDTTPLHRWSQTCPNMPRPNAHPKHTAFVHMYTKETMGSSCFLGLNGHSDPSCTWSVGILTILWKPQRLYKIPPPTRLFTEQSHTHTHTPSGAQGFHICMVSYSVHLSVAPVCDLVCLNSRDYSLADSWIELTQ